MEAKALLEAYDQRKESRKRAAEAMAASYVDFSSTGLQRAMGSSSPGPQIQGLGSGSVGNISSSLFVPRNTPGAQPSLEGTSWNRELQNETKLACARFWYYNNIPFNVASSPYWEELVTALIVAGKGFKAPSRYELSGPLLKNEVQNTQTSGGT